MADKYRCVPWVSVDLMGEGSPPPGNRSYLAAPGWVSAPDSLPSWGQFIASELYNVALDVASRA